MVAAVDQGTSPCRPSPLLRPSGPKIEGPTLC
jgi:hypothetical protein